MWMVLIQVVIALLTQQEAAAALSQSDAMAVLTAFNRVRSGVMPTATKMNILGYNESFAALAQLHASHCPNYSSNAIGSPPTFNEVWMEEGARVHDVMRLWVDQGRDYILEYDRCRGNSYCWDYVAMITDDADYIGCGHEQCWDPFRLQMGAYFVCYVNRWHPSTAAYESGRPCSRCPDESTCTDNQCSRTGTGPTMPQDTRSAPTQRRPAHPTTPTTISRMASPVNECPERPALPQCMADAIGAVSSGSASVIPLPRVYESSQTMNSTHLSDADSFAVIMSLYPLQFGIQQLMVQIRSNLSTPTEFDLVRLWITPIGRLLIEVEDDPASHLYLPVLDVLNWIQIVISVSVPQNIVSIHYQDGNTSATSTLTLSSTGISDVSVEIAPEIDHDQAVMCIDNIYLVKGDIGRTGIESCLAALSQGGGETREASTSSAPSRRPSVWDVLILIFISIILAGATTFIVHKCVFMLRQMTTR